MGETARTTATGLHFAGSPTRLLVSSQTEGYDERADFDGNGSDFPSGAAIELLHIQFKALAATEGMTLAFQFDLPRQSDVTFGGTSLLSTHSSGTIIIQPAPPASPSTQHSFDAANWEQLPLIRALLLALTAIVSLSVGVGWRYGRV
jgi:hypothetical protein